MTGAEPELVHVAERDVSPLVARAAPLARTGRRRLLGVAGPPGVGKSTVASAVVTALAPQAVLVPMDGFHLAESELRRLGRLERKGAIDTFDAAGFVALLRRLHRPEPGTVWAPRFDRALEEPVAGAIAVAPSVPLVVVEGNYLLADDGPWSQVRALLAEAWYLEAARDVRLRRLTQRHVTFGRAPGHAAARAQGSDERNAERIAASRPNADLVVRLTQ